MFGLVKKSKSELRTYDGTLSARIFGWRRIPTQEVQGYADWQGRPVGEPGYAETVEDRKAISTLFGIGAATNDPYAAGSLYRMLSGREVGGAGGPIWNPGEKVDFGRVIGIARRNEIVYRCLRLITEAAVGPKLEVQKLISRDVPKIREVKVLEDRDFEEQKRFDWDPDKSHPMKRLLMKPSKHVTGQKFFAIWLSDLHTFGKFFAWKVRSQSKLIRELRRLDPQCVEPHKYDSDGVRTWKFSEYDERGELVREVLIDSEDIIYHTFMDPGKPLTDSLSPVQVAYWSADADIGQTEFTRQFFQNRAVPSGILTIKNKTLSQPEADKIKRSWMERFSRWMGGSSSVAVLDQNAEYQSISSKLDELDSEVSRSQIECRLAMVFGIPPVLVYTYGGINRATNTNSDQSERFFWSNTMLPLFESILDTLLWQLLPDYEEEDLIRDEEIRLAWNYEDVRPMQEDADKVHARSRENVKAGIWTVAEGRAATEAPIDPYSDYYIRQEKMVPSYPDIAAADAALLGKVPSVQVIATHGSDAGSSIQQDVNDAAQQGADESLANQAATIDTTNPQASAVQNAVAGSKQTKPN